ncbi:hypothetical protein EW026_g1236 [Hermanssonia centrifuga]|uniref:Uncharacterized protein n=2 Tax=Hermanssonia centrifuga TaxID=98765 RepID=A0A4S4KS77_9APHY|nr:hypothetical protein EW026_g1236 [Hermanssonia centrifuga]
MSTKLDMPIKPLPQFDNAEAAKLHVPPSAQVLKLMKIEDPLLRSGYARLSLFPAATQKLYPDEFEKGREMGIL